MHGHAEYSESQILPGVYVCAQRENVNWVIKRNEPPYRVFIGYAGWGGGQLEAELKVGGWLSGAASPDIVFADDLYSVWRQVIQEAGQDILRDALNINDFPIDPSIN